MIVNSGGPIYICEFIYYLVLFTITLQLLCYHKIKNVTII